MSAFVKYNWVQDEMNVSNPADRALSISVPRIPKTNCHACLCLSSRLNFWTLMLWQLPLLNVWVTVWLCACPVGVGCCTTARDWTSVFSGRAGDNIVSSAVVSNTCAIEKNIFSVTGHKSCLVTCGMISAGGGCSVLAQRGFTSILRVKYQLAVSLSNRTLLLP